MVGGRCGRVISYHGECWSRHCIRVLFLAPESGLVRNITWGMISTVAPMVRALLVAAAANAALTRTGPPSFPCTSPAGCATTPLWHIPGPNPIITPRRPASPSGGSGGGGWASTECEAAASIIKQGSGRYYFSYHCTGGSSDGSTSYQDGFSTAASPLGPWSPVSESPALALGGAGAWDSTAVASLNAVPDPAKPGHWLGFYAGGNRLSDDAPPGGLSMGLVQGLRYYYSLDHTSRISQPCTTPRAPDATLCSVAMRMAC